MTFPPVDQIPDPPPGPGVRTPFSAPPTERDRRRMWLGLGLGGVLLLVCCGGGIAGFVGLVVAQNKAIPTEATAVVTRYLDDLTHEDYRDAYDQLCGAHQGQESLPEFTARQRSSPTLSEFTVQPPRIGQSEVIVPADLYTSAGSDTREFILVEDQQAGGLRICGGE